MILLFLPRRVQRTLTLKRGDVPANCRVAVLEPSALSVPGWSHDPENPRKDRLVTGGEEYPVSELTAVITSLDAVTPFDLPDVQAEDRGFVASEMTAFLRSWLQTLACPVLDPPTALALSGAADDRAVWSKAAAALAVADRQAIPTPVMRTHTVTVVAGQVIGPAPEPAAATAVSLAQAAGVTAARLTLTDDAREPALCQATPWWYAPSRPVLHALLAYARRLS